ncbi:unnamed protein product [Mytilus coruscus]|uniref:Reverse transcriptase/retrotransposon-derived protein RNase H-like domain-containing protein n=1 Tax=Mytilus coruscus TaxID=42192 RepID=A0A6J8F0P0_MYTCO|nr:unnamed protein product [Mytilus coruscus]
MYGVHKFYVVKGGHGALIGYPTASQLGLVKIIQPINIQAPKLRYPEVFRDEIDKCEFNKNKVTFFGVVFSKAGISPDPKKVQAVKDAEAPTTVPELRSFLGMTNYSSRFIRHYASICEPLRRLTRYNTDWEWNPEQQQAFDNLKNELSRRDNPADYMSRHPIAMCDKKRSHEVAEQYVNFITNQALPKAMTLSEVKYTELQQYRSIQDELVVHEDNILLRDNRIVMPTSLRDRAVSLAHEGHQGLTRPKHSFDQNQMDEEEEELDINIQSKENYKAKKAPIQNRPTRIRKPPSYLQDYECKVRGIIIP